MEKCPHKEENIETLKANFKTVLGPFSIELFADQCPETVWNFVNLAEGRQDCERQGRFYDGLIFHRVIKGFMIQGGCPEGSGMGGPGYQFGDECSSELGHDSEGILSMANAGPNTNGSQFFITLAPTPHLDGNHTIFGKVVDGMDVIKQIGDVQTGERDRPVDDVVIESVEIERLQ